MMRKATTYRVDSDEAVRGEFSKWLGTPAAEKRLFREGALVCDLTWANESSFSIQQLASLWMIRMFCCEFELYARRRSTITIQWQLRLVAAEAALQDGEPLEHVGSTESYLLGVADQDEFKMNPNRYPRYQLRYPVDGVRDGDSIRLVVDSLQPKSGGGCIEVWRTLVSKKDGQEISS